MAILCSYLRSMDVDFFAIQELHLVCQKTCIQVRLLARCAPPPGGQRRWGTSMEVDHFHASASHREP